MIDAVNKCRIGAVTWGRNDDKWRSAFKVGSRSIALGKETGTFNYHVNTKFPPRKILRIALAQYLDLNTIDADAILGNLDVIWQLTPDLSLVALADALRWTWGGQVPPIESLVPEMVWRKRIGADHG